MTNRATTRWRRLPIDTSRAIRGASWIGWTSSTHALSVFPDKSPPSRHCLPLGRLTEADGAGGEHRHRRSVNTNFILRPKAILDEVVPASFRVQLFKCFLDAAVSEQIARMVAMKSATENAGELIRQLSRTYNRARQSRITSEIMDIVGGVEALKRSCRTSAGRAVERSLPTRFDQQTSSSESETVMATVAPSREQTADSTPERRPGHTGHRFDL